MRCVRRTPSSSCPLPSKLSYPLNEQQVYVPIDAKISSSALDWAEKHDRREAGFDFAAEVRAVPSGQSVAQLQDTIHVHLDAQRFRKIHQSNLLYQGSSPGKCITGTVLARSGMTPPNTHQLQQYADATRSIPGDRPGAAESGGLAASTGPEPGQSGGLVRSGVGAGDLGAPLE